MAVIGTRGRHVIAEYWGCSPEVLGNIDIIRDNMLEATRAAQATAVANLFHQFTPTGVSGVVIIEESHLSIHTWPEEGYAACDFYTCGNCIPEQAFDSLKQSLGAGRAIYLKIDRGMEIAPHMSIVKLPDAV